MSESPEFAEACAAARITFVGPLPDTMRRLGNKIEARNLAASAGVPVMPATPPLPAEEGQILAMAHAVGFPVMLKASWGGGGRGMRMVEDDRELIAAVAAARREAKAAFGKDEVYLEKLIRRARHVEVQILGDSHGNLVHLYERDCTVQRRNQKVVERAPAAFLTESQRSALCEAALKIGRAVQYRAAGTVEFLQDADTGKFYFIEVNPRIQVEHTVTECVTGVDLVKAQIRIAAGARIGTPESGVPRQEDIHVNAHALQCRVTTEDPENNFVPDYGRVTAYRSPAGFGIRLDAGTAYAGAIITRFYDSLLVKVTAWSPTPEETIARMHRALWEFRIRGVVTNLRFLDQLIMHPCFATADYTTKFIDQTPELFQIPRKRDRATRLLSFIGDVIVNGNPEVKGRRHKPAMPVFPRAPRGPLPPPPPGTKQKLDQLGPDRFAAWMLEEKRVLLTDTSMRDAHQSLLATRFRTRDMALIAPHYSSLLPQLFSVECWGGATFDVAMRFLKEDPWARLASFREAMPNLLLQMLLRSANAVGYTNYPDNVVRHFVARASEGGIDVFRVFDCLNWVDNMRVAIEAVRAADRLCEAAICYTGNLSNPRETKYDLRYYLGIARELKAMGAHVIAIKDMAGLCQPRAAAALVGALRSEVGLPVHFHTHDTSGIAAASVLAAVEAGADAVDGAIDSLSGLTSQPNLGSIVEALRFGPRDSLLDPRHLRSISAYWEQVRHGYVAFESDIRAGDSGVYVHGMPGGQYTNLREQVRSLGIDDHRWPEVAHAYAQVNEMFGDIIKVTPTSKVIGDMAVMMVTSGLTPGAGSRSGGGDCVPGIRGAIFPRRAGTAARRLPAGAAEKGAGRQGSAHRTARRAAAVRGSAGGARGRGGQGGTIHHGVRARFPSHVSEGVRRIRCRARGVRRREHAADGRVLLWHAVRPGNQHRSGARKDADREIRHDQRRARGWYAHRVLRVERSAAADSRGGPQSSRQAAAAAKGRSGQSEACRLADAGDDRHGIGAGRSASRARRRAAHAGSDENGNHGPRGAGRDRQGGAGHPGTASRCQGSAGGPRMMRRSGAQTASFSAICGSASLSGSGRARSAMSFRAAM